MIGMSKVPKLLGMQILNEEYKYDKENPEYFIEYRSDSGFACRMRKQERR